MGCVVNKNKVTVSTTLSKEKELGVKEKKSKYFYLISFKCWSMIVDFLKYKEVIQVGKINRSLNTICRSHSILIKFYQKRSSSSIKPNTENTLLRIQKSLYMKDDLAPKPEKLYLRDNNFLTKKKSLDMKNYANTKLSIVSKTINFDKISIGSFQELQDNKKVKQRNADNPKATFNSKFTMKFKGTIGEIGNVDNKPKIYYDDYGNTKTSLIISRSLNENCSDNLTPSFKDSETSHDFISNIGDLVPLKNVNHGLSNNFMNISSQKKKSEECLIKDFSQTCAYEEKEFSNGDDISLNTIENDDRSINQKSSELKIKDRIKKSDITPSTYLNSLEPTEYRKISTSSFPKHIK